MSSWRSVVSREFFKEDYRRVEEGSSKRRAMLNEVMIWPLLSLFLNSRCSDVCATIKHEHSFQRYY